MRVAVGTLVLLFIGCTSGTQDEPAECVYATTCREGDCNGPVTKSGCDVRCGPGEVEELTCFRDGSGDVSTDATSDASRGDTR